MSNDDYLFYKKTFMNAGSLDRIIAFVNTTEDPPVERLMVPDMALAAAEHYAAEKNQKVLVLLTDMTLYADALSIVSNRMDQIPSKDSMPDLFTATWQGYTRKQYNSPPVDQLQSLQ